MKSCLLVVTQLSHSRTHSSSGYCTRLKQEQDSKNSSMDGVDGSFWKDRKLFSFEDVATARFMILHQMAPHIQIGNTNLLRGL